VHYDSDGDVITVFSETRMIAYLILKTARLYLHSSGQNTRTWWTDRQNPSILVAISWS